MESFSAQELKGKNILITGGLGFIGSSIARRCTEAGAHVTLVDACLEPYGWNLENIRGIEDQVTFINGDVRNFSLIRRLFKGKDIVFHMAAQVGREISMEKPALDAEINCMGTLNCLEAARQAGTPPRIIYAGSRGQAGEPVSLPVTETHPDHPTDVYGINKLAAEKYLFLYHKVYGIPAVSLRLNNVYGPRCQMHASFYGILNWFISLAMQGLPIPVYGDGSQTRDYIYIDDVVDAFIRAAVSEKAVGEMFYVGSGRETVFLDMVREVIRAVGKGRMEFVPFPETRKKIDIRRFVVSTEKIHEMLGWQPSVEFGTGMRETVRYYEEKLDAYLKKRGRP